MNMLKMLLDAFTAIYIVSVLVMLIFYLFIYKRDDSKIKVVMDDRLLPIWALIFTPFLNTFIATKLVMSIEIECEVKYRKATVKDRLLIALIFVLIYLIISSIIRAILR